MINPPGAPGAGLGASAVPWVPRAKEEKVALAPGLQPLISYDASLLSLTPTPGTGPGSRQTSFPLPRSSCTVSQSSPEGASIPFLALPHIHLLQGASPDCTALSPQLCSLIFSLSPAPKNLHFQQAAPLVESAEAAPRCLPPARPLPPPRLLSGRTRFCHVPSGGESVDVAARGTHTGFSGRPLAAPSFLGSPVCPGCVRVPVCGGPSPPWYSDTRAPSRLDRGELPLSLDLRPLYSGPLCVWHKDAVGWETRSLTLTPSSNQTSVVPPPALRPGGGVYVSAPHRLLSLSPAPSADGGTRGFLFFPPFQGRPESLAALITAACRPPARVTDLTAGPCRPGRHPRPLAAPASTQAFSTSLM